MVVQLKKKIYFHPLEVVGRGSETQLQVGEHLAGKRLIQVVYSLRCCSLTIFS